MKKLVISVVLACLASGQAFAGGATGALKDGKAVLEDLGTAAKGIKAGEGAAKGAKANGAKDVGADGTTKKSATETDKASATTGQAASGVDSHVTCPADSAMNQVSRAEQDAIFEANAMGYAGSACASNFTSKASVEVVAAADAAIVKEAKRLGALNALKASMTQKLSIAKAAVRAMAAKMGISVKDAKSKYEQLCAKSCDVASKVMCSIAGDAAVATN